MKQQTRKAIKKDLKRLVEKLGEIAVETARDRDDVPLPYLTGALRESIRSQNHQTSNNDSHLEIVYGDGFFAGEDGKKVDVDYAGALEFAVGRNKRHEGFIRKGTVPVIKQKIEEYIKGEYGT